MNLTVNLEFVIAVLTVAGALLAVMRYYGGLTSNYAVMQSTLLKIDKELLEIKTIVSKYDEDINELKIEIEKVKKDNEYAHQRLDALGLNGRGEYCEISG